MLTSKMLARAESKNSWEITPCRWNAANLALHQQNPFWSNHSYHKDKILVNENFVDISDSSLKKRFNSLSQLSKYLHQKVHTDKDVNICMDLTYMYHLLSTGYELPDNQQIKIEKKIGNVEMGW